MRLHHVGFPHTRLTPAFSNCAYSQKLVKFAKMMGRSHDVVVYGTEGSETDGAELVQVLSEDERIGLFGPDDPNALPAWPNEEQWRLFNARTIVALLERAEPRDLILLAAGRSQQVVRDALPHLLCVEPGVGYEGIFTPYCSFESYAWMHHLYAKIDAADGRWFDTVIPNYFDPADFPTSTSSQRRRGGDYLLFVGRLIGRKGPHVAAQIAAELDLPLVVAGPGAVHVEPGIIVAPDVTIKAPKLEYVGSVGPKERGELMAGARAVLAPTTYIEPFGGVAVEAMMAGTPAITTDWGAFTETVWDGVSGFRFRSLAEGVIAADKAQDLDRDHVREWALSRYSLDAVGPMFDRWFAQLQTLWGDGWNTLPSRVTETLSEAA